MFRSPFRIALLAGSVLLPTIVHAQTGTPAQTGMTAEDAAALRAEVAALRAQLQMLEARIAQAEGGPAEAPAAVAATQAENKPAQSLAIAPQAEATTAVAWKGAPQMKEEGWSFKPKGRIQFDTGIVSAPESGISDKGLGTSTEVRRLRMGAEGTMPGDFGYKLEIEFSDNQVDLVDTYISWKSNDFTVRLGNQNQYQSLDELIGDTTGSVMERAAFTDAFNFERRMGLAMEWQKGPLLAQGGIFADDVNALSETNGDENNSYGVDGRIVFAPKLGNTQLHFGASGHWRDLASTSDAGARYRQRPFLHSTNSRLIDTGGFPVSTETHYGLELAGAHGRWHAAAETHWLKANRIGGNNPAFFGGYAEIGYYLTAGDTRVYKNGIFDRSPPHDPVDQGGPGSVQLTLRYDYLDLDDKDIRGGKQNGYIAGLVWTPINYLRFNINYAHLDYKGALLDGGARDNYGVDVFGLRAELDY